MTNCFSILFPVIREVINLLKNPIYINRNQHVDELLLSANTLNLKSCKLL